ncbi:MAG TPA: hypothetical protein VLX09_25530 [Stellaceae bacterium]|nr:hypothetical protein [Stellaceae bacterium]
MDKPEEVTERGAPALPFFGDVGNFNGQAMRWAIWPLEFWLQWQADLLRAAQPAAADWMARRREGTEAALKALERLCACHDARDVSKIHNEWMEDEAKRLESDMRSVGVAFTWPHQFAKLSGAAAQMERPPA